MARRRASGAQELASVRAACAPLRRRRPHCRFTHETLARAVDPPLRRPRHTQALTPLPRYEETVARAVTQALTPPPRPQARPTPTRRTRTATSTSSSRWSPSRTPRPRRARPTSCTPRPTTVPFPSVLKLRGAMDSVSDFESGGCGFESRRSWAYAIDVSLKKTHAVPPRAQTTSRTSSRSRTAAAPRASP